VQRAAEVGAEAFGTPASFLVADLALQVATPA
jgi:hypothetical protein